MKDEAIHGLHPLNVRRRIPAADGCCVTHTATHPHQVAVERGAARTPGAGLAGKRSPEGESAGGAE